MIGLQHLMGEPLAMDPQFDLYLAEKIRIEIEGEKAIFDTEPVGVAVVLHDVAGQEMPAAEMDDSVAEGSVIAVVAVTGVMTRHGGWFAAGTAAIGRQLRKLDANASVGQIILDVDSPGGSVMGTPELSDIIYGIRQRGQTRIIAVADPLMASAAIWTATAAEKVYSLGSGVVGSIGVISMYVEYSKMLAEQGVTITIERTPENKARFSSSESLTEAMRETMIQRNRAAYGDFLTAMARNRGVEVSDVESKFGGGEVMSTSQAIKAGLIDGVATIDEIIASAASANRGRSMHQRAGADLARAEL